MSDSEPASVSDGKTGGYSVPQTLRIAVLLLVAFASSSAYLTRHFLTVVNTTIQAELKINSEDMGYVFGAFSLSYAIFQIPSGALGLKIGTRQSLPLFSTLWSLITVWTSLVLSFVPLLISRLTFGIAQAGLVPNTAQIIKDWFPSRLHGSVSAMIGVAMSLGGVATIRLTTWLLDAGWEWREIVQVYSLVGIVWAVIFWVVFRTRPEQHPMVTSFGDEPTDSVTSDLGHSERSEESRPKSASDLAHDDPEAGSGLWKLCTQGPILWMCIQSPFRAAGYALFVTFFPQLLQQGYGLSKIDAGNLTAWPLFGVIVGGLIGGGVIDMLQKLTNNRTISRSGFGSVALLITTVLTAWSAYATTPHQLVVLITLGTTFSGMASPAVWAGLIDLGGKKAAVISGASNMVGGLGVFVVSILIGKLVHAITINTTFDHSDNGWEFLILVHAGFYLCAALAFVPVRIPDRPVTEPPEDPLPLSTSDASTPEDTD